MRAITYRRFSGPAAARPERNSRLVYNYGGADGILLRGEDGGAGQYMRRGMSFIDVDGPGHGGTLRHHKLYAPPDSERVAKAVIDYLVTRAGCRCRAHRSAWLKHGRLLRPALRDRRKAHQSGGGMEWRV